MTQISLADVQHLAQLSSLQLEPEEAESLRVDLERILSYIEELSELDTDGVEPTYQVTDLQNVWRNDTVDTYGVSREQLLALAPEQASSHIKVQKVL